MTSAGKTERAVRLHPASGADRGMARRSPALRRHPQLWMTPLIAVVGIGAWMEAIRLFGLAPIVLPEPSDVAKALVEILQERAFYQNLGVTMYEFGLGFALGALAAVAIGALFARVPLLERGFSPYIIAFQNFPKIAIAPLFVTWFGFGATPKVVLAMILAFFPVFVNVIVGMKSSSRDQVDLMRVLAATEWQTFWQLRLKVAMPYLFAGLRVAAVFALLGAITGEFISSQQGLGYMLLQQNAQLSVDGAFALLIVMGALGLAVHWLLGLLHRRLVYWDESVVGTQRDTHSA